MSVISCPNAVEVRPLSLSHFGDYFSLQLHILLISRRLTNLKHKRKDFRGLYYHPGKLKICTILSVIFQAFSSFLSLLVETQRFGRSWYWNGSTLEIIFKICQTRRSRFFSFNLVKHFHTQINMGHLKKVVGYSGRNVQLQLTALQIRTTIWKIKREILHIKPHLKNSDMITKFAYQHRSREISRDHHLYSDHYFILKDTLHVKHARCRFCFGGKSTLSLQKKIYCSGL